MRFDTLRILLVAIDADPAVIASAVAAIEGMRDSAKARSHVGVVVVRLDRGVWTAPETALALDVELYDRVVVITGRFDPEYNPALWRRWTWPTVLAWALSQYAAFDVIICGPADAEREAWLTGVARRRAARLWHADTRRALFRLLTRKLPARWFPYQPPPTMLMISPPPPPAPTASLWLRLFSGGRANIGSRVIWSIPRNVVRVVVLHSLRGGFEAISDILGIRGLGRILGRIPTDGNGDGDDQNPMAELECTLFAPDQAREAEDILIQVILHPPEEERRAISRASLADPFAMLRGLIPLGSVKSNDTLDVCLSGDGLLPATPVVTVIWRGRVVVAPIPARVARKDGERIVGNVTVKKDSVPLGSAGFTINVSNAASSLELRRAKLARYHKAFLSYASPDRVTVLGHYQLLSRLGLEVFQDVLSLDPGERWEKRLYEHIDDTDLFLLYWSAAAAGSEWVRREAEYAMKCQDKSGERPHILPIVLEGPPPPPVPESLKSLHFNDAIRYVIAAQAAVDAKRAFAPP